MMSLDVSRSGRCTKISSNSSRRLCAIMFTDIVGYTVQNQLNEAKALETLEEHNRLLRPFFPKYHGREVKTIGDSFLVEFESALDATNCAVEIQKFLHNFNSASSSKEPWKIRLRIGIHLGDVIYKDKDILGDAVNIASRIQSLAEPEGLCVSQQVYDQIHNKIESRLQRLEGAELKNVRFPTNVYSLVMPWDSSVEQPLDRRRLAILPFSNISPDPNDEYFADGMSEELIATLSEVPDLIIISRTSVSRYKNNKDLSVKDIARQLGVGSIIEGSVRKSGDDLRITVQLIDASEDKHIWSKKFDRKLDNIFSIQSEIAESVTLALKSELFPQTKAKIQRGSTKNMEAYTLYLKGRYFMRNFDEHNRWKAIQYFTQALELDPGYALALSALSESYTYLAGEEISEVEGFEKGREYAQMALEADENLSEAHCSLGIIILQSRFDFASAERELRRAIEINPSNSTAHLWLGDTLALSNRFDEALSEYSQADELDPLWAFLKWHIGWTKYYFRRYDEAIRAFDESLELDPDGIYPRLFKALVLVEEGKFDEAINEAKKAVENRSGLAYTLTILGYVLGVAQRKEEAAKVIQRLEIGDRAGGPRAFNLALVYLGMGEEAKAVELFEKAFEEHDTSLLLYGRFPIFDRLKKSNERFANIVKKVGME